MSLPKELVERHEGPFRWGVSDCVQWAADAVEHFTGHDYASQFSYSTEVEGRALIASYGGLEALVTSFLGPSKPAKDAELGDVVLSAFDLGQTLGVADPPIFWLRAPRGLVPVEMTLAIKVWSCRKL